MSDEIGVLAQRMDGFSQKMTVVDLSLKNNRKTMTQLARDVNRQERRLNTDHRAWSLAMARRSSGGAFPKRVLMLATIHRTGSTRLFDLIRCHPDVYVEPLNVVWESLGLVGRRYPTGLSDRKGDSVPIEVQSGVGANIRAVDPDLRGLDRSEGSVAIEKTHPQFFHFDAASLSKGVDRVERELASKVDFVYLVRNPLDVMWSMSEYKQRDPSWYAQLEIEDIPDFVNRSFRSLSELALLRPGIVINYSSITPGSDAMKRLGQLIDPSGSSEILDAWLETGSTATNSETISGSLFIGERDEVRGVEGPSGAWSESGVIVDATNEIYTQFLEIAESSSVY